MARKSDRYDDRYDDRYNDGFDDGFDDGYDDRLDDRYDDDYDDYENYDDHYNGGSYRDDYDDGFDDDLYGGYDDGYDDDYDQYESRSAGRSKGNKSDRRSRNDELNERGQKRMGKKIILFAIEIIVLLAVVGILFMVTKVEKIGNVDLPVEEIMNNVSDEVKESVETGAMKGYRNIAFFGVDSTEGDLKQNTRSDAIMICSINEETGDVKLISVYRDSYLNIGNDTYLKCNTAYAQGGPQQAINMLNQNLDLSITDFVTVGFGGLTEVINALGGVEICVEQDEISHLNNYQSTMAKELGMSYTEVTSPGKQLLDGLQATAYCRIRYTRGWDYKRAARQREVLYAVMQKAKQASPSQLVEIANNAFDQVYTSYSLSDILEDVNNLANLNINEEANTDDMQNGFPQEDLRIQANLGAAKGDCVIPVTLEDNVVWLHEFLFNEENYDPSDTVKQYSEKISADTAGAEAEEMTSADHT